MPSCSSCSSSSGCRCTRVVVTYFKAARQVLNGGPIYGDSASYHPDVPPSFYVYPPPLAVIVAPLAAFGPSVFQAVWYGLILVAFWAYACGLVKLAGFHVTVPNVLTAGLAVQLTPGTIVTMSYGNADFIIWALCALALTGGTFWAGIGAAFKIYPGWLLVASASRGERAALIGFGVAVAVLGGSLAIVGVAGFRDWTSALSVLGSGPRPLSNISVTVAVLRLLAWFGFHGHGKIFLLAAPLVGVPVVIFTTRRFSRELQGSIVLATSLLLGPLCWWYYAPLLLMPAAAWLRSRHAERSRRGERSGSLR